MNCYFFFFGAKVADVYSLGVCTGLMYQNSGVPLLDLFGTPKLSWPRRRESRRRVSRLVSRLRGDDGLPKERNWAVFLSFFWRKLKCFEIGSP